MAIPPTTSNAEFRSEVVRISELVVTSNVLDGITFVKSRIIGPAVLVLLENISINQTKYGGSIDAVFWPIDSERRHIIGGVGVRNCTFLDCAFEDIGLAGSGQLRQLLEAALNSTPDAVSDEQESQQVKQIPNESIDTLKTLAMDRYRPLHEDNVEEALELGKALRALMGDPPEGARATFGFRAWDEQVERWGLTGYKCDPEDLAYAAVAWSIAIEPGKPDYASQPAGAYVGPGGQDYVISGSDTDQRVVFDGAQGGRISDSRLRGREGILSVDSTVERRNNLHTPPTEEE